MANGTWGHCKQCNHFDSPSMSPLEDEEANCNHPIHSQYHLKVVGYCGCDGFALRAGVSEEAPAQE
jgi:hypothetical protein